MSRFDTLKEQNPEWDISFIDLLKKVDPSGSNRYIEFLLKCLKIRFDSPQGVLDAISHPSYSFVETLKKFHEFHEQGLVEQKDISTYKGWNDLLINFQEAEEKARMKEAQKQITIIYEDDTWLMMRPESYEAAVVYGKGTKWCITEHRHWLDYEKNYYFIYIINKTSDIKYCVSKHTGNGDYQTWLSNDLETSLMDLSIPYEFYSYLFKELKENNCPVGGEPVDDYKIWTTGDGTKIPIDGMTTSHLRNTIRLFDKRKNLTPKLARQIAYMHEVLVTRTDKSAQEILNSLIQSTAPIVTSTSTSTETYETYNWLSEVEKLPKDEEEDGLPPLPF